MCRYNMSLKTNRTKSGSLLVTASLLLLLMGMTVTVRAQERRYFTPAEYSHLTGALPLHLLAQRYGIIDAIEFSHQLQEEEEARREMERVKKAQQRDQELREKVTKLAQTSLELYQRFNNPSEIHADTPQLAKKCEELAKAIKKLLR